MYIISYYRNIDRYTPVSNRIISYIFLRYRQISYRWVWESISNRIVTNHPIYTPIANATVYCLRYRSDRLRNNNWEQNDPTADESKGFSGDEHSETWTSLVPSIAVIWDHKHHRVCCMDKELWTDFKTEITSA